MIVAVGMPNATEVPLSLDDCEGNASLQHAFGSYYSHDTSPDDGNINVGPWQWLALLWGHHLDV